MKMSDVIADFIGEMLSDNGGVAELQRKSLADRFSCVPSQINYVIETRFTPEHGYLVESQRGGGGYIRIVRLMDDKQRTLLEAARRAAAPVRLLGRRACRGRQIRPRPPARCDLPMRGHGHRDQLTSSKGDSVPLRYEKSSRRNFFQ